MELGHPYGDPGNSQTQMDRAPDPARFVLSQDVVAPAGEVYNYSGGSAVLIQAILKEATGKSLNVTGPRPAFRAARHRAGRMGALPGHRRAGCCLRAAIGGVRFAKLGKLVLAHGVWQGKQVAPAAFVEQATAPHINGLQLSFYGYQFWLGRSFVRGDEIDWSAAVGLGGQRIFVVPALDLVAVVNADLYRSPMQAWVPLVVLNRYVLAAAH